MRRLLVLIRALPDDARVWAEVRQAQAAAQQASKITRLRERQRYWDEQKRLREETA